MPARKRRAAELEDEDDTPAPVSQPPSTLQRIRNMWEFASFMQYLFMFGKAIRAEEWDVEDFEDELLKPEHSPRLSDVALVMLKFFSSFRPLNLDTFDEDIRRRYDRHFPNKVNPFGYEAEPVKFASFDVYTKIRVLQQLSIWTFNNPDRIREKMSEKESEQLFWRMEPLGWDEDERSYFVFDDDRLYRRTDAPLPLEPEPKPQRAKGKASKKTRSGARSAKKRRLSRPVIESSPDAEEEVEDEEQLAENGKETEQKETEEQDDGLGGMRWELIAITLDEYTAFLDTIRRSRDKNAKELFKRLTSDVLPVIEKRADQLKQKEQRKLRELENLQKMATAKRSSRLAGKAEQRKAEEDAAAAERKHQEELDMAHREQAKQHKLEEDRESRMMTREQRLKDREVKRILHEEELKKLEEDRERAESDEARLSERHLKAEMEKKRRELEKLAQEEDWTFDCAKCGLHGQNLDDGSHSIACDKCGVWQHSACHGFKKAEAERDDFHFVCTPCKRKADHANQPKIPSLKFKMSSSPALEQRQLSATPAHTRPPSQHSALPPIGRFDGVRVPSAGSFNALKAMPNGHAPSTAPAPSSSHQPNPVVSTPQLTRDASSPAATASFRYSLQRGDSGPPPPQAAYSPPPQQSWNHQYPRPHLNGSQQAYGAPHPAYNHSTIPPMGTFGHRPLSQGGGQQPSTFARPPSQGHAQASPSAFARPAPAISPPQVNGHSKGDQPPSTYRSAASPSGPGADTHRTPVATQSRVLHATISGATHQPSSPPVPSYLKTPQYPAPNQLIAQTPLPAASISPLKQESPRLGPAPTLANSPSIMPPTTTLSPSFGNVPYNPAPVKKSSPPHQQPQPPVQATALPHLPGTSNGSSS